MSADVGQPFPHWLKAELDKPGRSQSALARHMGLDSSAINRLVNGKRELKYREMDKITEYLSQTAGGLQRLPVRAIADIALAQSAYEKRDNLNRNSHNVFQSCGLLVEQALDAALARGINEHPHITLRTFAEQVGTGEDFYKVMIEWSNFLGILTPLEYGTLIRIHALTRLAETTEPTEPFPNAEGLRYLWEVVEAYAKPSEAHANERGLEFTYTLICSALALALHTGERSRVGDELRHLGHRLQEQGTEAAKPAARKIPAPHE